MFGSVGLRMKYKHHFLKKKMRKKEWVKLSIFSFLLSEFCFFLALPDVRIWFRSVSVWCTCLIIGNPKLGVFQKSEMAVFTDNFDNEILLFSRNIN